MIMEIQEQVKLPTYFNSYVDYDDISIMECNGHDYYSL